MNKLFNIFVRTSLCFIAAMMSISCLMEKDQTSAPGQSVMIELSVSASDMTKSASTDMEKAINSLRDTDRPHYHADYVCDYPKNPLFHKCQGHKSLSHDAEYGCKGILERLRIAEMPQRKSHRYNSCSTTCRQKHPLTPVETTCLYLYALSVSFCLGNSRSPFTPLPPSDELHRKIIQGIQSCISIKRRLV